MSRPRSFPLSVLSISGIIVLANLGVRSDFLLCLLDLIRRLQNSWSASRSADGHGYEDCVASALLLLRYTCMFRIECAFD